MLRNHLSDKSAGRKKSVFAGRRSVESQPRPLSVLKSYLARFEPLESQKRLTATVIEVNPTLDVVDDADEFTSLREAILAANASPDDHEIHLPAGSYVLTRQGANEDAGLTGDLDVTAAGALKIIGAGSGTTTLDASRLFVEVLGSGDRAIDVHPGVNLQIEGGTIAGGHAPANQGGGGIRNTGGQLTVSGSQIKGNMADYGGDILSHSDLPLALPTRCSTVMWARVPVEDC